MSLYRWLVTGVSDEHARQTGEREDRCRSRQPSAQADADRLSPRPHLSPGYRGAGRDRTCRATGDPDADSARGDAERSGSRSSSIARSRTSKSGSPARRGCSSTPERAADAGLDGQSADLSQRRRQQDPRRPASRQHRARRPRSRGCFALQRVHALQPVPPCHRRRSARRRATVAMPPLVAAVSTGNVPLAESRHARRAAPAAPTRRSRPRRPRRPRHRRRVGDSASAAAVAAAAPATPQRTPPAASPSRGNWGSACRAS